MKTPSIRSTTTFLLLSLSTTTIRRNTAFHTTTPSLIARGFAGSCWNVFNSAGSQRYPRSKFLYTLRSEKHTHSPTSHHVVKTYSDSYEIKTLDIVDVDQEKRKVFYIDEQPKEQSSLPPIVVVGGTAQTINSYLPHIQSIRKKRRLIIIELRGQGQTDLDSNYCTMEQIVKDLRDILDTLNLSKVHLSGFSFGGRVAMAFAAYHPSIVEKLSVTGVPLVRPNLGKMVLQSWEDALRRNNMRECAWSFLINGYSDEFINKHYSKIAPYVEIIIAANQPEKLYNLIRFSHVTKDDDPYSLPSTAKRIQCPMQLIAGKYDRIAGYEECLQMKTIVPRLQVESLLCGHLMPFEDPAQWRNLLLKFFS